MRIWIAVVLLLNVLAVGRSDAQVTEGALLRLAPGGGIQMPCPLRHTDVQAEVSGNLARVRVTQKFRNPWEEAIEAVYTFPLPQQAAADGLTLRIGDRVVRGRILRREEAQAVYEAARAAGQLAGLLDQERPNVFTQSVANIPPGSEVEVTISYVETMKYDAGAYEFVFPMVVGPRYIPRGLPDAKRITPPVTLPVSRAGHDVAVSVTLDAGLPIDALECRSHQVSVARPGPSRAVVTLKDQAVIPNKDFVLRYDVAGKRIQDAVLTHHDARGGFFTLMLAPPERAAVEEVAPKELVFVLDTSGSMSGFPIEKAKETMKLALAGLYPQDTFNLITFSGDTHILFPEPVQATPENLRRAQQFLESRSGGGGTEMMKAIRAALDPSDSQKHLRIVCFMTDGYVGNDLEIIGEIQKHPNARVFSFGIGTAVNRFLLDKMAEYGRGEVEYVSLHDDGSAAARRFHERVRNPLLTDIAIDWGGLAVTDVYPKRLPDLFAAKPVVVTGRYTKPGRGVIRLRGRAAGRSFVREVPVDFPAAEAPHDVLATLWARSKVDDLMGQDWAGLQFGAPKPDVREAIVKLGLDYRLMTRYTSFVAVEEMTITEGGKARRIEVPVEMPEGVSYEGVFGIRGDVAAASVAVPGQMAGFAVGGVVHRASAPPPAARPAGLEARPASKLHPSLAALVERLKTPWSRPAPEEAKFVRNGKAEIQAWLQDTSPATLGALQKLGFEVVARPASGRVVIGRIPIERLGALGALEVVVYVTPQTGA